MRHVSDRCRGALETPADVELWIEEHNQALQQHRPQ
jgi:hypothetical protein